MEFTSADNIACILATINSYKDENIYEDENFHGNKISFKEVFVRDCCLPVDKTIERLHGEYDEVSDDQIRNALNRNNLVAENTIASESRERDTKWLDNRACHVAYLVSLIQQGINFDRPLINMNVGTMKWSIMEDGNHRVRAYQYLKRDVPCDVVYFQPAN